MKKFTFLLLLILPAFLTGQAEKIYSIGVQINPKSYFLEQSNLWKKEIAKFNTPDAWLNYYAAARMSNLLTQEGDKPFDLSAIVKEMGRQIPGTFEYHHVAAWDAGHSPEAWEHLQKAYQVAPERHETYDHFVSFYNREGNVEKRKLFNQKWYNSGHYSAGMLRWNYNMLMSVEPKGILITWGDGDTYPSWMLQDVHQIRTDILVENFHLLRDDEYRNRFFSRLGIPPFPGNEKLIGKPVDEAYRLLGQHLSKYSKRPVYFGIAMNRLVAENLSDSLYLEGLAFRYSPKHYDNIPLLVSNLENRFLTDHLKIELEKDISESLLCSINFNYIPALLLTYQHYKETGKAAQAVHIKTIGLAIGARSNKENLIKAQFDKYQ